MNYWVLFYMMLLFLNIKIVCFTSTMVRIYAFDLVTNIELGVELHIPNTKSTLAKSYLKYPKPLIV